MYDNGRGVAQDDRQAVQWFKLAAGQGEARDQFNLGFMYAEGHGLAYDLTRAHMWWNIAAASGSELARKNPD